MCPRTTWRRVLRHFGILSPDAGVGILPVSHDSKGLRVPLRDFPRPPDTRGPPFKCRLHLRRWLPSFALMTKLIVHHGC
jgi:hypothetical protein